jgi:hypothetical protein
MQVRHLKDPQSINVLDLTRIAHVPPVRTLRQFVTQVRHCNVRTILLKQAVNPVLPSSAALVAHEAHHLLLGRSLTERIGTVCIVTTNCHVVALVPSALLLSRCPPLRPWSRQ